MILNYRKRCRKCKQHKPIAGGHQRRMPTGIYFVCAECKHLVKGERHQSERSS